MLASIVITASSELRFPVHSLYTLKALKLLTSLGYLENIETLDLSHKNLSGSTPPTLTKLQQLTILDVSKLRGRIPNGGKMGTLMLDPNYFANNSGLCGIQIRLSCFEDDGLPLPSPPPTNTRVIRYPNYAAVVPSQQPIF